MNTDKPLLEVQNLKKYFEKSTNIVDTLLRRDVAEIQAVDDVSFTLDENDSVAVIGESGCGKTTLLLTLIGLHNITQGDIIYRGTPVTQFSKADWKEYRRNVQVIFQDPFNSLDPRMTVEASLKEPLQIHDIGDQDAKARDILERVELSPPEKYLKRKPANLSGGEKQRVSIGRALIVEPDIILADEPVSMLDVSTQAAVLNMLKRLIQDLDVAMIYISHDLSTVSYISEMVNVMYLGRIVETAPTEQLLDSPKHPYTQALVSAIPIPDPHHDRQRTQMSGSPREPIDIGEGCRFRDRCPEVIPPDGIQIDQGGFREIMAFRERLERGDLALNRIAAGLDAEDPEPDEFAMAIKQEHFDQVFEGDNEAVLNEALMMLAEGDRQTAIQVLRERFESICERTPEYYETEDGWYAACHLYNDQLQDTKGSLAQTN